MPQHRTEVPRLGAVESVPRWSTGPPRATGSYRWPCLSRPRRGAVLAPTSALAAHSGLWVRSAVAPPPPPASPHQSLAIPDHGPPRRGALRVPAEPGDVCVVVRLSPPVLRSGLRWLRGSGDDPVGCGNDGG